MPAVAENGVGFEEQLVQRQLSTTAAAAEKPEYQRDVRKLVDLFSKLNPSAKDFVPASRTANGAGAVAGQKSKGCLPADGPIFVASGDYCDNNGIIADNKDSSSDGSLNNQPSRRKRNGIINKRRGMNDRARRDGREESIRRTVYVSNVVHHVAEEKLAEIFVTCGEVIDCRICSASHSALRFAFIEFSDEDGARAALNLDGTMLDYHPLRVLPSNSAILPVNPKLLPRSDDEKELVLKTVYCTNIDKKITQQYVKVFFEQLCGEVSCLRLLGDKVHSTYIAFVEFVWAESAIIALSCSGMFLGSLPIRVCPSKTPVRLHVPHTPKIQHKAERAAALASTFQA